MRSHYYAVLYIHNRYSVQPPLLIRGDWYPLAEKSLFTEAIDAASGKLIDLEIVTH